MKTPKTHKILAVDDQPENLEVIVKIAEGIGEALEVLQEVNATFALEIAREEKPDLIITDWEMPGMDGIAFIRALHSDPATRHIPVIMCTGIMTTSENLEAALNAGAVDYIRKPIDAVEFRARVRSMLQLSDSFQTIRQQVELLETQKRQIANEREKSEALLLNILPRETADELKEHGKAKPKRYEEATVMFADFADFTRISESMSPEALVEDIHYYFSHFDQIVSQYGLEKIKTIGDAYMCAGGLPVISNTHAVDAINAALHIQAFMAQAKIEQTRKGRAAFDLRIGIHTGTVVAGIVGLHKFQYDIWGDAVNIASRMESSGAIGRVNISEATHQLIQSRFKCAFRGKIAAKGKGEINMYFVEEDLPVPAAD